MIFVDLTNKDSMKPILETKRNNITKKDEKRLYIEGKMLKYDELNANIRLYEKRILSPAVKTYDKEYIKTNRATGEIMHPNYLELNLKSAAIKIVELMDTHDNFYYGKALVLDTPEGNLLKTILKDVNVGVSSRGEGASEIREDYNRSEYEHILEYVLRSIDVVSEPSVVESVMNTINENRSTNFLTDKQRKNIMEKLDNTIAGTNIISIRKKDLFNLLNDIIVLSKRNIDYTQLHKKIRNQK